MYIFLSGTARAPPGEVNLTLEQQRQLAQVMQSFLHCSKRYATLASHPILKKHEQFIVEDATCPDSSSW